MKKWLILILGILLCACTVKLPVPGNLRFSEQTLTWDLVAGADSYIILINENTVTSMTNSYDFHEYEEGEYTVKVAAQTKKNQEPIYSPPLSFTLTKPELAAPANIRIDNGVIRWDQVDGATEYLVRINGKNYTTATNSFPITGYDEGEYFTVITAFASGYKAAAGIFQFTIVSPPEYPSGIVILNNTLKWSSVADAAGYTVRIDEETFYTSGTEYDLNLLPKNAVYMISVKTHLANGSTSEFSPALRYDNFADVIGNYQFTFSKSSQEGISLDFTQFALTSFTIYQGETVLPAEAYTCPETLLTILPAYLKTLPYGVQTLEVISDIGKIIITITVADDREPTLLSRSTIVYSGDDLVLTFELYDGVFVKLFSAEIADIDCTITGSTVTISGALIAGVFADHPNLDTIIIGYHLRANVHDVLGFIFVNRK